MGTKRRRSRQTASGPNAEPTAWQDTFVASILYEDNHLLAVNKPAMLPTMGTSASRPSLVSLAKDYIKRTRGKPGNVYVGVVSRVDAPVSGVVVLARTSKAAARLAKQFLHGDVEKIYWAIVDHPFARSEDHWIDWVAKDERRRRMEVTGPKRPGAKQARLSYRTLRRLGRHSLLEIRPETGRKHQIRLALAHRANPILGDRKYGSTKSFPSGIALHARELVVEHPVRKTPLRLIAPLPSAWSSFGLGAGQRK